MDWKQWGRELAEAAIQGAVVGALTISADPGQFNFHQHGQMMLVAAGAGALIALLNKLRQSPLPRKEWAEQERIRERAREHAENTENGKG